MDTISSIKCDSVAIPSSSCTDGVCNVSYPLLKDSGCSDSTNLSVTVYATNILGNGPESLPVIVHITTG